MGWVEHTYNDAGGLADAVAGALQAACVAGIERRGAAMLALAGGQTPWPVYRQLAHAELAWSRITLLPTDERCVAAGAPASNLHGLTDAFAPVRGVQLASLTVPDGDPDESRAHARAWLARHPQPFAAVLLGMGGDGHTASLFPGAPQLADALETERDACRIDPDPLPPEAPYPRISLTVSRLLRADALHLVITGAGKRATLEAAIASNDSKRYPVMAILQAPAATVHIHWSP